MVRLAVAGSNEFVVGFQLAGIKNVVEIGSAKFELSSLVKNKDIGIIIIDEDLISKMDTYERNLMEGSVEPVFIPLSTNLEQDSLKRLIKKSIGVDLWK